MVTELLDKGKIITTISKAKELRPFAEKMITLGKKESLHARRQALAVIRRKSVVHKLFDSLAPRYADRSGGYTRIIRLGYRKGDSAERALIELVESETEEAASEKQEKKAASKPESTKKTKAKSEEENESS